MTKKYRVAQIKIKEKEVPCGYDTTTEYKNIFISKTWWDYDTLEEAEDYLAKKINGRETWTIIPVYT